MSHMTFFPSASARAANYVVRVYGHVPGAVNPGVPFQDGAFTCSAQTACHDGPAIARNVRGPGIEIVQQVAMQHSALDYPLRPVRVGRVTVVGGKSFAAGLVKALLYIADVVGMLSVGEGLSSGRGGFAGGIVGTRDWLEVGVGAG